MPTRQIIHADMDAFFAAVEVLDFPELAGRPLLVGHDGPRSVVCTASYEARQFGCHSAMAMTEAKRRCPHALIRPVRSRRYGEISQQIFRIFHRFSPLVQTLSIDEAFIDLTGTERLLGPANQVAEHLKKTVKDEVGLTVSVGLAENMFLAKIASDLNKPDGLTVVPDDPIPWLASMPITRLWGVGPKTAGRLQQAGIRTVSDLQAMNRQDLQMISQHQAEHLLALAHGQDQRAVTPDHEAKSIGQEQTFADDLQAPEHAAAVLLHQVELVSMRLRRIGMLAAGLTVKIRDGRFHTITRSCTLDPPTDRTRSIWLSARDLFQRWAQRQFTPLRLIGMTVHHLMTPDQAQPGLFGRLEQQRDRQLDQVTDAIRMRFGKLAIGRGGPIDKKPNTNRQTKPQGDL